MLKSIHCLLALAAMTLAGCGAPPQEETEASAKTPAPLALAKSTVKAEVDGVVFRDLNKNGELDVYEDLNAPLKTASAI